MSDPLVLNSVSNGGLDISRLDQFRSFHETVSGTQPKAGQALVRADSGADRLVAISGANAGEVFAGIAKTDSLDLTYVGAVETVVVPSDAPYTVTLGRGLLVAGQIRCYDNTDAAALTEGDAANAGEFSAVDATGVLSFNAAQAGNSIQVTYRSELTARQRDLLFQGSAINRAEDANAGEVSAIRGPGIVYTMYYDATIDWSPSSGVPKGVPKVVKTGAGGLFTVGGNGATVGRVHSVPSPSDPYLGIEVTAF